MDKIRLCTLLFIFLSSCGGDDGSPSGDYEPYLETFPLVLVSANGEAQVIGQEEGQIDPSVVKVLDENFEETGFTFEKRCESKDEYSANFDYERPHPTTVEPGYAETFYIQLGEDIDTLKISFGPKIQKPTSTTDSGVADYYPTVFTYNNFSVSETVAERSECDSGFILFK